MAIRNLRGARSRTPIPKNTDVGSWKIEIISNGTTRDVTADVFAGDLHRAVTVGLSNFSLNIDNSAGKYRNVFSAGDIVNIYYDYTVKASLSTIRFKGYIDGVYDSFNISSAWFLTIEGRDAPSSSTNEHFGDTEITIQFTSRNILDAWLGTTGTQDGEGNFPNGTLYNSGLILKVYDTATATFRIYKDLSTGQKTTLKGQTGYTQTTTETHVDKTRLSISKDMAVEGDYEFRIFFDSGDEKSYLMVHPETAITNNDETVAAGQNLLDLSRYGADTTQEANRVKERGVTDGNILLIKTKQDTARQSALWIKDLSEANNSLVNADEVSGKADARLAEKKLALKKGTISTLMLPTLQPGEKISLILPYVITGVLKIKSFDINFGTDIDFTLDIQDRETRFSELFKDRIDENTNALSTDNPNGMRNTIVYDFSDFSEFTLVDCEINNEILKLLIGKSTGTCTTDVQTLDDNVTVAELRIKANQFANCSYRVSNDNRVSWKNILPGQTITFSSIGKKLSLEITLNESATGVSPEFDKTNLLLK